MRMRFFKLVFCTLLASAALAACTQSENEVCQSNRDCDDGLVCTVEDDGRGFCQDPKDVDMRPPEVDSGEPDLGPDPDAAVDPDSDAGSDAGSAAVDASSASQDDAG
jgi:hypothetical protein